MTEIKRINCKRATCVQKRKFFGTFAIPNTILKVATAKRVPIIYPAGLFSYL